MALTNYPSRPSVGDTGGASGWPAERDAYDDVLEENISEAYSVASSAATAAGSAATAAGNAETAAGNAETAAGNAASDASDALAAAALKVNTDDVASLNTLGWAPAIFIPKNGVVPSGLPTYTLVVEAQ